MNNSILFATDFWSFVCNSLLKYIFRDAPITYATDTGNKPNCNKLDASIPCFIPDNSSSDSYLKSLVIKDYKLDFSKKVKRYILNINSGTKKLDISAIANNDKASIKISGNDNLKEGSIIKIIVTAENETRTVYQITVHIVKKSIIPYIVSFIIVLALGYGGYNYYKNLKLKRKRELEIKLEQERLRLEEEKRRLEAEKKKNTKKKTTAKKGTIKKNNSSTKKKSSGTKTSAKKNVKKVSKKK